MNAARRRFIQRTLRVAGYVVVTALLCAAPAGAEDCTSKEEASDVATLFPRSERSGAVALVDGHLWSAMSAGLRSRYSRWWAQCRAPACEVVLLDSKTRAAVGTAGCTSGFRDATSGIVYDAPLKLPRLPLEAKPEPATQPALNPAATLDERNISNDAGRGAMLAALLILVAFFTYFAPAFIASRRQHPNANAIGVLNLLLGWTVLGWIVALVWAFTAVPEKSA